MTPSDKTPLELWIIGSRDGKQESLNRLAEYQLPKAFEFANRNMRSLSAMDDFGDVAVNAVKSVCLRFRNGEREFLGEKELGGLLRQFVVGKIRDHRKYHLRDKRNVNKVHAEDTGGNASATGSLQNHAVDSGSPIWLDERSMNLPVQEQTYLSDMLGGLGGDVQGLFTELVKRLDENPRRVLMLITTSAMTNAQIAESLDCAPASVERYRQAIRRKLEEIVNE